MLVDDAQIRILNRDWRGIDKATDVLSWPQDEQGDSDILGDVAISLDTAARQASAREWSDEEEIALLLVHGILHLLGYEDDTEEGAEKMRCVEHEIIGKLLEKVDSESVVLPNFG